MLTIRAAQMSALIDARLGQVAEELKDYLRLNHADAIAGALRQTSAVPAESR